MAIVRCARCASASPRAYGRIYAVPVGSPESGVACGTPGCSEPGLVWLRGAEALEYRGGRRVLFPLSRTDHVSKVLVKAYPGDHDHKAVAAQMPGGHRTAGEVDPQAEPSTRAVVEP